MKVVVVGMGHLGMVTAACLASVGHDVRGFGAAPETWAGPSSEPGLLELIAQGESSAKLAIDRDQVLLGTTIQDAEVVWYCEDTPVDANDRGDVDGLVARVADVGAHLRDETLLIVSSQVPVGTMDRIVAETGHGNVAYVPENLKKGQGVRRFLHAERWIVGVAEREIAWPAESVLAPFGHAVYVMPTRAAEMTKHAINCYLAACITLANELALVCAKHGVDPTFMERGLRTDARVGEQPPVTPGGPIRGGTLLRDVWYMGAEGLDTPVLQAIAASNAAHIARESEVPA